MPNGDPNFRDEALRSVEAFFSKLAPLLERFASKHGLKIEKYYHDSPSWSFQFRHPHGGVAKIDVEMHSDTTIRLWACWWLDDYDKATRSIKRLDTEPLEAAESVLEPALESMLVVVAQWQLGSWDSVHGGYQDIWHKSWTKRQFAALNFDYPKLKG